jgi:hypothetical protein
VQQEIPLVRGIHRGAHRADARRTQPEIDPFRARRGEQRHRVTAADTQTPQHVRRRAGAPAHLLEGHVDAGNRHHDAVGILLGPAIQHGRNGEAVDPEIVGPQGAHQACEAAGSGSPSAV